ncbi:MAG: oligosaccharide flippase family protein [Elusimicrobiales bacterium]|nr:oligosaccharide flippase family protein [Elusimicrobiales bacterium]
MDNLYEDNPAHAGDIEELKRRSFSGIGTLVKRQVAVRLLSFFANIALARLLVPEVFGVYAIVTFVVQFFSTFGDVGIGAALIQKKRELTREEISSTFWLQQLLVLLVVCAVIAAAPLAARVYPSLPSYGSWLIRAMALSFALASFKTVPAILMERKLDFGRIALVDIAETAVFYASVLALAFGGYGVWSFIVAALLRSFSGACLIYLLSGWRPTADFKFSGVREIISFGLPYQGNTILGFVKDAVIPLFVGAYSGAAAVGFVNWARSSAFAPLMLSEAFGRVAFPAFSRIQADRDMLARAVERSMRAITLLMFPITSLMVALGPEIISVVFTDKWLPALPAYYFYCTSPLVIGVVLPMYSAILALGRSGIVLKMMLSLFVLEWGLGVPLVMFFGFNGIAVSQPFIALLFCFVYLRVLHSESVQVSVLINIRVSLISALLAGMAARLLMGTLCPSPLTLAAAALSGAAVYVLMVLLLEKTVLLEFKESVSRIASGGNR